MSNKYVSGRMPSARGGMRSNSKLPKGNQHTTPEREPIREAERERKRNESDPAYMFGANPAELKEGRRRVRNLLTDDQEALKKAVDALKEKAYGGSYKHLELWLAYVAGKPIAIQENVSVELTGDDLFDAVEAVKDQLTKEDFTVIEGGREESA